MVVQMGWREPAATDRCSACSICQGGHAVPRHELGLSALCRRKEPVLRRSGGESVVRQVLAQKPARVRNRIGCNHFRGALGNELASGVTTLRP